MSVKVTAKCDTCGTVVFPDWRFINKIPDKLPCPICKGEVTVLSKEYVQMEGFPVTCTNTTYTDPEAKSEEETVKYGKTRKGNRSY